MKVKTAEAAIHKKKIKAWPKKPKHL